MWTVFLNTFEKRMHSVTRPLAYPTLPSSIRWVTDPMKMMLPSGIVYLDSWARKAVPITRSRPPSTLMMIGQR